MVLKKRVSTVLARVQSPDCHIVGHVLNFLFCQEVVIIVYDVYVDPSCNYSGPAAMDIQDGLRLVSVVFCYCSNRYNLCRMCGPATGIV